MDVQVLRTYVERALSHAGRMLDWLHEDPQRWDESVSNHPSVCLLEKVHSEVALLGLVCLRLPQESRQALEPHLVTLAGKLEQPEVCSRSLARVLRLPQLSPAFALPIVFREKLLNERSRSGVLLRQALQHPLVEGVERYPFRRLDVAWVKAQAGMVNVRKDPGLIASTCLAMPVHPIYASLTDMYALTHAFMYDSDFGAEEPSEVYAIQAIEKSLRAIVSFAISEGDPDILGEAILCAWCMPEPPPWAAPLTEILLALWQRFGFIPPAQFEMSLFTMTSAVDQRHGYMLRSSYHPTLVGGVLALVAMNRSEDAALPSRSDASSERGLSLQSSLEALKTLGCRNDPLARQLIDIVDDKSGRHPSLALILADAALVQSCRKYDLDVLLRLLHELSATVDSACYDEAYEFFRAQQVEEGVYGAHFLTAENRAMSGIDRLHVEVSKKLAEIGEIRRRAGRQSAIP